MKEFWVDDANHMIRQRLNALLSGAPHKPLITVCAGAGCGKTRAVADFLRQQERPSLWVQCSQRDNDPSRLWDTYTNAVMRHDPVLGQRYRDIGFPDTQEKMGRFLKLRHDALTEKPYIIVFDDLHLLKEPPVLGFMHTIINEMPPNVTMALIYRELPQIAIRPFQLRGRVTELFEADLNFTEKELADYLGKQDLCADRQTIHEIYHDTRGWAFAVNIVARSLKRAPGYAGYVRNTLKKDIFRLMETESWDTVSDRLKRFLARLSLVDHLSAELVDALLAGDEELLDELQQQSAYIRFDNYAGAYLIHHLFLDFLRTKQQLLSDGEKEQTYKAAADWCKRNSFVMDALGYYEKAGDYPSITSMFGKLLGHTPHDLALFAIGIFERAPAEAFDRVACLAAMHLYTLYCLARLPEFFALAERYEQRFLTLPPNDTFRNHTLGLLYFFWGSARLAMSTRDDRYDFDGYYIKAAECLAKSPMELLRTHVASFGAWFSSVGSAKKGAPQDFAQAVIRTVKNAATYIGAVNGTDALCLGELAFYQNNLRGAEPLLHQAMAQGRKHGQFETLHRALFYVMRIAIAQGNRTKTEQAIKEIEALLEETAYARRFITCDIAMGWHCCAHHRFEQVPDWLKGDFSPYVHGNFIANFGNQIKARYHYATRDYLPLLSYIAEMKQRESVLYGRVEMLAMEACVQYHMKNKAAAWGALKEAYETAAPNGILMPFIELGKDMRTLTMAALREHDMGIPKEWLEDVRHKALYYAGKRSALLSESEKTHGGHQPLSAREHDILSDLYNGLSQAEIAKKRKLSINTVKMNMKNIYEKLDVHKITDLVRIAAERRLV